MLQFIQDSSATSCVLTPTQLKVLLAAEMPWTSSPWARLTSLVMCGESPSNWLLSSLFQALPWSASVYNGYGPTETCIGVSYKKYAVACLKNSAIANVQTDLHQGTYTFDMFPYAVQLRTHNLLCVTALARKYPSVFQESFSLQGRQYVLATSNAPILQSRHSPDALKQSNPTVQVA